MATIITRVTGATAKGSALTNAEMDQNFINLNEGLGDGTAVVNQSDIGTKPNQIPLNQMLGTMSTQDSDSVNIGGGKANLTEVTVNNIYNNTECTNVKPTLLLDFANSKVLDPRITFSRSGIPGSYYDGKTFALAEQNFWLYSQDADNAAWQKSNMAVAANAVMAPDGTMTADAIALGTAGTGASIGPVLLLPAGTFVMSIYAKAGTNTVFDFRYTAQGVASYGVTVDLGAGTIVNQVGSTSGETLTNVGGGWYRASFVFTLGSASIAGSSPYLRGNSASMSGSTMFIWGAQLEQRSAVSAYTPTTSAAITNYIPQLMIAAANQARFDHDPITGECKGLLVEESRANLAIYAEQFDNAAWTANNASILANCAIAPDGALTGDKLIGNATLNAHSVYRTQTLTAVAYTVSVFAKAGERSWLAINVTTSSDNFTWFNLAAGVVGAIGSGLTASIISVGNGWYRCSVTFTATAATWYTTFASATGNSVSSYINDGYSGLYIWGAQLEAGSFATSYIPTTSAQVTRSADTLVMSGVNFSSWYNRSEGTLYTESYKSPGTNNGIASINVNGAASVIGSQYSGANAESFIMVGGSVSCDFIIPSASGINKVAIAYATNNANGAANGVLSTLDTLVLLPASDTLQIGCLYNGTAMLNACIKRLIYFPKRLSDAEIKEMTV